MPTWGGGKIILSGPHGIGSRSFEPTTEGYEEAARLLVGEYQAGRCVDENDSQVQRVLYQQKASSVRDLLIKKRGW